jgi:chromosome segregation ATPase
LKGIEVLAESDFKKIDNLKGTILALKKQIEPLKVEVQKQSSLAKQRKREKRRLRQNLSEKDAQIKHLNEQLSHLGQATAEQGQGLQIESLTANANQKLQQALSERDAQIKHLNEQLSHLGQTTAEQKQELQLQIESLTANANQKLQQALSEKDAQINHLNEQLSSSGQGAEQNESRKYKELLRKTGEFYCKAQEMENLSNQMNAEKQQLLEQKDAHIEELLNQLHSKEKNIQEIGQSLERNQQEIGKLKQDLSKKDSELEELRVRGSEWYQCADFEINYRNQLILESQAKIEELNNRLIQARQRSIELQQQLTANEHQLAETRQQLTISNQQILSSSDRNRSEKHQLAEIQQQLDVKDQQLTKMQQNLENLQQLLNDKEHRLAETQQESERLRQQTQNPTGSNQNLSNEEKQQLYKNLSGSILKMQRLGSQIKFASLSNRSFSSLEEIIEILPSFMYEVTLLENAFSENSSCFDKLLLSFLPINVDGNNQMKASLKIGAFLREMMDEKKLFEERYDQIETEKIKHARNFIAISRQCERRIALLKRYYAQ